MPAIEHINLFIYWATHEKHHKNEISSHIYITPGPVVAMKLCLSLVLIGALLVNVARTEDDGAPEAAAAAIPAVEEEPYTSPELPAGSASNVFFHDNFDNAAAVNARWIRSASKKAAESGTDGEIAQYDGVWSVEAPLRPLFRDDLGLVLKTQAKHAAIAAPLRRPFVFAERPLVVQYEVQLQDGQTCGGSYVKLLTQGAEASATGGLAQFNDKTPYTIMFGPDKCGNDIKLHFIFRHVNPLTGAVEEKHCRQSK